MDNPIYVTKPSLPPLDEYHQWLAQIWKTGIVTHNGPLVQQLEADITRKYNLHHTIAVTNGTIALQLALRTLNIRGEVITTPFSWIATPAALRWEGCEPVFVDVDENTFNIEPDLIEEAITERTQAIMPVHVFSNPADTGKIEAIGRRYNLPVIYDAAHAFGVAYKQQNIMQFGAISCGSFHATKIFNTGEGGACFTQDKATAEKIQRLRFFGHNRQKAITDEGLNGKMTEIHAALGLANLPYIHEVIEKRKAIYQEYRNALEGMHTLHFQQFDADAYNYSYMPVVFESENQVKEVERHLNAQGIFPRRYFYPSLNTLQVVKQYTPAPVSESLARRILCLPSYTELPIKDIRRIARLIRETIT